MPEALSRTGAQGLGEVAGVGLHLLSAAEVRALLRPASGEAAGRPQGRPAARRPIRAGRRRIGAWTVAGAGPQRTSWSSS
ncbi:hypothetical protein [Streptomyces sp. CB03911]|uniref:hypothetical protein n=1 Tax=Streptomyces sp. CB03911 TaxID=1804758 RepID=UPI0018FEAC6C|nr:hypothetical protein [Streptomyces sp. CB03911]